MTNSTSGTGTATERALLEAIGTPPDLTLCFGPGGAEALRALVAAETLLGALRTRTVWLDELAALRGDTLVLCAPGGFAGSAPWGPVALAAADLRFERVVVLPTAFDSELESVREALAATRAIVFARDETALAQIGWLCDARVVPEAWPAGRDAAGTAAAGDGSSGDAGDAADDGGTDAGSGGAGATRPSVLVEAFARVRELERGTLPPELIRDGNAGTLLSELLAARGPAWLAVEWVGGRLTPLLRAPGVLPGVAEVEPERVAPAVAEPVAEAPQPISGPEALRDLLRARSVPYAPAGIGAPAPVPPVAPGPAGSPAIASGTSLPPSEPVAAPEAPISPPSEPASADDEPRPPLGEPAEAIGSSDGDVGGRAKAGAGAAGNDRKPPAREPILARAGQALLVGAAAAIRRFIGPGE